MRLLLLTFLPFVALAQQPFIQDNCDCGLTKDCRIDKEGLIGFTQSVATQCGCETLCKQNPVCTFYTWFDPQDTTDMAKLCLLFYACHEEDHWDSHRHTCPVEP